MEGERPPGGGATRDDSPARVGHARRRIDSPERSPLLKGIALIIALVVAYAVGSAVSYIVGGMLPEDLGLAAEAAIVLGCVAASGAILLVLRRVGGFRRSASIAVGFLAYHLAVWGSLALPATTWRGVGECAGVSAGRAVIGWSDNGPSCELAGDLSQLVIVVLLTLPIGGLLAGFVVRAVGEATSGR